MEGFAEIGKRLSNWGRWGSDDERGTLNHITPERVLAAAACIRSGKVFELSIPLGQDGPQTGLHNRHNPIHTMTILPGDLNTPDEITVADDLIVMGLQCATQWDALAHVGYDNVLYNGVPASEVTAREGAVRNGIDKTLPGMVGRGVLLDIAQLRGVDWIRLEDEPIEADELERAVVAQDVRVRPGDAVLIRTGWRRKAIVEGWTEEWITTNPGLNLSCAEWIHDHELAAVASDNWGVEQKPPRIPNTIVPLHCVLIRDMGMMLGEMFDLEALSADCAQDGQWDFFLSAPPLRVVNGAGSPVSPIAVK